MDKFRQMRELKRMRDEAMKLQKQLAQIQVTESKGNVEVTMTGDMKVVSVTIDEETNNDIKDAVNKAISEAQKKSAQKMQEMGGGLAGLLGGNSS